MSLSKVIGDFIDIDDAKDFAAGAVESVTGTLDMMDIPRNYLMSQVGMQPPGTYTDAARDALNLQPNTESSAYMAGQIVGGAATGGAGAIRQAGKQGLQYATKEAGKQLGYEGLATAGSEAGAQAGQHLGGDNAEFIGSLAGGFVTGSAGQTLGNPNKMDIMGGTRSETIDPMMVNSAVAMERAGKSKSEIWNKTGMMRGADGNWRYEIDDSNFEMRPFTTDDINEPARSSYQVMKHDDLYRAYPDTSGIHVRAMTRNEMRDNPGVQGYYSPYDDLIAVNALFPPAEQKDTLLHEMQHAVQQRESHSRGASPETSRAYRNESHFQQIDRHADEVGVTTRELEEANFADRQRLHQISQMSDFEFIVAMNNVSQPRQVFNSSYWYEYSDDVVREIGPPPRRGKRSIEYAQEAGKVMARLRMQRLRESNDVKDRMRYDVMSDFVDELGLGRDALDEIRKRLRSARGKRDRAEAKYRLYDFNTIYRNHDRLFRMDDDDVYRLVEGEAEAFNTGKRMNMTAEERRRYENMPLLTMRDRFNDRLDTNLLIPSEQGMKRAMRTDGGVLEMVQREEMMRRFEDDLRDTEGLLLDAK